MRSSRRRAAGRVNSSGSACGTPCAPAGPSSASSCRARSPAACSGRRVGDHDGRPGRIGLEVAVHRPDVGVAGDRPEAAPARLVVPATGACSRSQRYWSCGWPAAKLAATTGRSSCCAASRSETTRHVAPRAGAESRCRSSRSHPTQITVGYREVAEKRREWRERSDKKGSKYLGRHMIPIGAAARRIGTTSSTITTSAGRCWRMASRRYWSTAGPRPARPRRPRVLELSGTTAPGAIPTTRASRRRLQRHPGQGRRASDDPYRSLAGELRRAGGFAKDITPFSEFIWADYLRRRVKPSWSTTTSAPP